MWWWIRVRVGYAMCRRIGKKVELGRIPSSIQVCTPESLLMICKAKSSVKMYVNGVITVWESNGVSKCLLCVGCQCLKGRLENVWMYPFWVVNGSSVYGSCLICQSNVNG